MSDNLQQAISARGTAVIKDPTGLHARPAVKLTKLAKSFISAIQVKPEKQEHWINAKSPNAVMKMKALSGELLQFNAEGDDADAAINALVSLVNNNFQ